MKTNIEAVYDNPANNCRQHWVNKSLGFFVHRDLLNGQPEDWSDNKWRMISDCFLLTLGDWNPGEVIYGDKSALSNSLLDK